MKIKLGKKIELIKINYYVLNKKIFLNNKNLNIYIYI